MAFEQDFKLQSGLFCDVWMFQADVANVVHNYDTMLQLNFFGCVMWCNSQFIHSLKHWFWNIHWSFWDNLELSLRLFFICVIWWSPYILLEVILIYLHFWSYLYLFAVRIPKMSWLQLALYTWSIKNMQSTLQTLPP